MKEGFVLGDCEGNGVGFPDLILGRMLGTVDGDLLSFTDGTFDGSPLGDNDGELESFIVGVELGS